MSEDHPATVDPAGDRARARVRSDVEVVLCTYNGAAHVRAQIDSIFDQTVLPGRVHVYDDGSSDDTLRVVSQGYAERPPAAAEVELIVTPADGTRHGAAGNFMRGLRASRSALVALADQDDVWRPDRLERAVDVLDSDPSVLLVASDAALIDAEGRRLGRTALEAQRLTRTEAAALARRESLQVLIRRNVVPGMTFTLRRELLNDLGDLPPGVMHDYRLALRAAATNSLVVLPRPLVDYRIHGGNAIGLDAGDRDIVARFRARWKLIRTPLADLPQWTELVEILQVGDPARHLPLALDKLGFERRRRFQARRGLGRVAALTSMIRSDDYRRFDVGGWRGAVKDFLRPQATDIGARRG